MAKRRWCRTIAALAAIAALATPVPPRSPVTGSVDALGIPVHGDSGNRFDTEVKTALADVIGYWQQHVSVDRARVRAARRCRAACTPSTATRSSPPARSPLRRAAKSACSGKPPSSSTTPPTASSTTRSCGTAATTTCCRCSPRRLRADAHRAGVRARVRACHAAPAAASTSATASARSTPSRRPTAPPARSPARRRREGPALPHRPPNELDQALAGYLQVRDTTPGTPADITHGDGFDRLSAIAGRHRTTARRTASARLLHDRKYTERGFVDHAGLLLAGQPAARRSTRQQRASLPT